MATPRAVAFLEYVPLRLAVGLVDLLPVGTALALARGFGRATWALLRKRRRTATENVLLAGLAADRAEAERIARASFESFAMLSVESLKASRLLTPESAPEHVAYEVPPETWALFEKPGQPVILASAHLGNWELSGHLISFTKPLVAVARNLDNPYAQRFLRRRNPRTARTASRCCARCAPASSSDSSATSTPRATASSCRSSAIPRAPSPRPRACTWRPARRSSSACASGPDR